MIDITHAVYRFRLWLSRAIAPPSRVIDMKRHLAGRPDPRYDPKKFRQR